MSLYKAVRPDGTSFHDPSFAWATEPGGVTTHPGGADGTAASYLSVATVPTDCTGMSWPCRLLEVEPVSRVWTPDEIDLPNKRAGLSFRTVRELPAHDVFGPQGEHVAALIERAARLTEDEIARLDAAGVAAGDAAVAARDAAWRATVDARVAARDAAVDARYAAWVAAWDAAVDARDAARALIVRDLLTTEHYDVLTTPWRSVIGPIHPDDPDIQEKP